MNKILLFTTLIALSFSVQFGTHKTNVNLEHVIPTPQLMYSSGSEEFHVKDFTFQFFHQPIKSQFLKGAKFIKNDHSSLKPYIKMVNEYIETRLLAHPKLTQLEEAHKPIVKLVLENIDHPSDLKDVTKIDESYMIHVKDSSEHHEIEVSCKGYVSFLRALETLFQLFDKDLKFTHLPLYIQDKPSMKYRGIMVDTARHYFSIQQLQNQIDGMRMNKLNVLHLHFTDSESFPVEIPLVPELSQYGAFSQDQVYTLADILRLQHYAQVNGVLLVPEFDTPAHTRSWSLSPKYADLQSCPDYPPAEWGQYCEEPPCGNIDPVADATWDIIGKVVNYTQVTFDSDLMHMGGDEVKYLCWDQKPSIKQFMNENNITDYNALEAWFRQKQANLISPEKRAMYWINGGSLNLNFRPQDILQFWDKEENYHLLHEVQQDIVLSTYDYLYLDCGTGNPTGGNSWCDPFKTWLHIYQFEPRKANIGDRLIGAEAPIWSERVTEGNLDSKIWPRAISFAIRMWNLDEQLSHQQLAQRIVNSKDSLIKFTSLQPSSISSQYCELHTDKCFFDSD